MTLSVKVFTRAMEGHQGNEDFETGCIHPIFQIAVEGTTTQGTAQIVNHNLSVMSQ
jgi:hypothetical protein